MSHLQTSGQPLSFTIKYKEQVLSLGEKYKSRHGHSRHNTVDLRLHLDNYQSNNGHKQNQGGSNAGIFLEPKCRNKKAQFGMSTSRSWEQQRVPIYYSEEESFVPQGKVVYQGYTPKNSYYCLRTMKGVGVTMQSREASSGQSRTRTTCSSTASSKAETSRGQSGYQDNSIGSS